MAPSWDNATSMYNFVVREGNGVKGLVDSGILRVPGPYIQPIHERIDETAAGFEAHSPIDLALFDGPEHEKVVDAICSAAETLGFFQVVNHGVSLDLLEQLKETAHKFFAQSAQTKAVHLAGASSSPLVKYGTSFVPEKEKALEWKDYVSMVYTNEAEALQHWPNQCRDVALEYLNTSMKMVRKILQVLMEKLGVKAEDLKMEGLTGMKMVNMNYYPACPNPELTVGVGRHSDMGTLTVLLQDGIGGLYVKVDRPDTPPLWAEIPPIPGALVINIGDTLQIISNGRYKSAEHRVRTTSSEARVSVPIFTTPAPTEIIGPLAQAVEHDGGVARYRDVMFGDYMNNFFGNAHDGKKSLHFAQITPSS